MRKYLLFALLSIFYTISLHAQSSNNSIRCIYLENYIKDSAKPKDIRQDEFALDIYLPGWEISFLQCLRKSYPYIARQYVTYRYDCQ